MPIGYTRILMKCACTHVCAACSRTDIPLTICSPKTIHTNAPPSTQPASRGVDNQTLSRSSGHNGQIRRGVNTPDLLSVRIGRPTLPVINPRENVRLSFISDKVDRNVGRLPNCANRVSASRRRRLSHSRRWDGSCCSQGSGFLTLGSGRSGSSLGWMLLNGKFARSSPSCPMTFRGR